MVEISRGKGGILMDLSVVIVSWNVRDLLRRCLQSVYDSIQIGRDGASAPACEVFVVDNASTDGSASMVREEFPSVRVMANDENRGFTAANNQALRLATGRYWLLVNPDAELANDAAWRMITYMEANPEVAVVGPRLLYPDGAVQSSRRRFPTRLTGLVESTQIQQWFPHCGVLQRYYVAERRDDEPQRVDWVVGACFMVRAAAATEVGLFDERYFMYSEELDWCYRFAQAGWHAAYLPEAVVIHHEARSSEQNTVARDLRFHESKCLFYTRAYGRAFGTFLRAFVLLTFVYRVFEESLKLVVVPRHRRERWKRLQGLNVVVCAQAGRLLSSLRIGSRSAPTSVTTSPREG